MVKFLSEVENIVKIAELRAELSKRNSGEVLFETKKIIADNTIDNFENLTGVIDLFVNQFGYSSLDSRWKEISQEDAQKIITFIMTHDLAYSRAIMSLQEAEKILVKLSNFFSDRCRFFTNALFADNYSRISAWDSITKATFDTGIVSLCDHQITILWVKDED